MSGRVLMVQGTASSVGKSLLVTALCRIYARRGLRVAPFKSQNMALNSAVTSDGGEIGRAQYVQAEAARTPASVDMNPILLKPEGLSTSQVVVRGRVLATMHFRDFHRCKPELRSVVGESLDRLRATHDLVIIEGAGSPAEVNLKDRDLVNMWVAERADSKVLLVTDIDRGGAMAALVGTLELLEPPERARVGALVVNKFRGDPSLFADGVRFLERRTGVPVAGVITHLGDAGIASEDSLDLQPRRDRLASSGARIAIIKLPRLSNFDEFESLAREPGVEVRWVEQPADLAGASLVILPGTKCTTDDLAWLRRTGIAGAVVRHADAGGPVLGICGGFEILGDRIFDPEAVESRVPDALGLALLPVTTRFHRDKVTTPVRLQLGDSLPLLDAAAGLAVDGYEIHCGRVAVAHGTRTFGRVVQRGDQHVDEPAGAVSSTRAVAGTLMHGLFEDPRVRRVLLASLGVATAGNTARTDGGPDPYDAIADHFAASLDLALLDRLMGDG